MKSLFILLFSLTSYLSSSAEEVTHTLYKGRIDNSSITLYLKQEPNPCGGETGFLYHGIYQYGSGKSWIELDIAANGKGNVCMTEHRFTGVLILKRVADTMEGIWISPDGKTQLKVSLKKQGLSENQQEEMEKHLERTHYENNDC